MQFLLQRTFASLLSSSSSSFSSSTYSSASSLYSVTPRSFALSGCGWLMPFHLGVMHSMHLNGYFSSSSIISGTSGGSIVATIACSELPPLDCLEYIIEASLDKTFKGNIHSGMKKSLAKFLPHDIVQKCDQRLHICVTKLWPSPNRNATIINRFESKEDLLDAIAASCFIPLYSAPSMVKILYKN